MAEPLAVALHAVQRLRVPPGEPVLLIGCGTIGGLSGLLLSRLHQGDLLFSDLKADRARMVAAICGGTAIDLAPAEIAARLPGRRLRYALDATGSSKAIGQTIDLLSGGGALALVGISHGRLDLDPNSLVEREIALLGCHAYENELPEAVSLLPQLQKELLEFSDVLASLDEVPAAYQRLLDGQTNRPKTIVRIAD
jgi:(R,R)-butanediol dehydrogenase/meso-butanediol dehydrogenase/diacetyl reductase